MNLYNLITKPTAILSVIAVYGVVYSEDVALINIGNDVYGPTLSIKCNDSEPMELMKAVCKIAGYKVDIAGIAGSFSVYPISIESNKISLDDFIQIVRLHQFPPGSIIISHAEKTIVVKWHERSTQQVDSAEPSTNAVPPSKPSGSAR